MSHPWRCWKPGWMGALGIVIYWTTILSKAIGLKLCRWLLSALSSQAILSFSLVLSFSLLLYNRIQDVLGMFTIYGVRWVTQSHIFWCLFNWPSTVKQDICSAVPPGPTMSHYLRSLPAGQGPYCNVVVAICLSKVSVATDSVWARQCQSEGGKR